MEKHTRHTFWRGFAAATVAFGVILAVQAFLVGKLVEACL